MSINSKTKKRRLLDHTCRALEFYQPLSLFLKDLNWILDLNSSPSHLCPSWGNSSLLMYFCYGKKPHPIFSLSLNQTQKNNLHSVFFYSDLFKHSFIYERSCMMRSRRCSSLKLYLWSELNMGVSTSWLKRL